MLLLLQSQPPVRRSFLAYFPFKARVERVDPREWTEEDELLAAFFMIMRDR